MPRCGHDIGFMDLKSRYELDNEGPDYQGIYFYQPV
jgi:hypothetical protein